MAGAFDEIKDHSFEFGFNELTMYALKMDAMLSVILANQAKILAKMEGKSEEEMHAHIQDEVETTLTDHIRDMQNDPRDGVF